MNRQGGTVRTLMVRPGFIYGTVLLAVLCVFPTLVALWQYWLFVNDYHYGVLIAATTLWLLWRQRVALRAVPVQIEWRYLPLLLLTLFAWFVLWQGNSELGQQLLVPIVVAAVILTVAGKAVSRLLWPALIYFYLAIPVWDLLLPLLQQLTIYGGQGLLTLLAVPVTVAGHSIVIPEGTFEVVYGCSGKRYLLVAWSMVGLFGILERIPWRRLVTLLVVTTALAIVTNWLRVTIVIYAGHITGMQHHFVSDSHKGLGNFLFAVLLVLSLLLARRFAPTTTASVATPLQPPPIPVRSVISVWVVLCALIGFVVHTHGRVTTTYTPQLATFPLLTGAWQGPMPSEAAWQPEFTGYSDMRRFSYRSADTVVELYANVYGMQQQGHELIFYANTLLAPGVWRIVASTHAGGLRAAVVRSTAGDEWILGHTYVVGGVLTRYPLLAQLLYGLRALSTPPPAGVVALLVPCRRDCQHATDMLQDFWSTWGQALTAAIPRVPG